MTKRCILALEENPDDIYLETSAVLLKLVDNVIKDPLNPKYRSIKLGNPTVANKLLPAAGAMECLFEMGFEEGDDRLILPESTSIENLKCIREEISVRRKRKVTGSSTEGSPTKETNQNSSSACSTSNLQIQHKLLHHKPFLHRVALNFQAVLRYENKILQSKALELIPLEQLELSAEKNMRSIQKGIKKGVIKDEEIDIQEFVLLELLSWFKKSFFKWVDSPECKKCKGCTKFIGNGEETSERCEAYSCSNCQEVTYFIRYNDPEKLLKTRRGRCGEWANCFTLFCRALGWDCRYIADETDHVWTEVYSATRKKWLHCDPCENVCNSPLMYEAGWGKKLSYVMAYSKDEVQDVTWRYSCNHPKVLKRRTLCKETELLETIFKLRKERQKNMSKAKVLYLNKRILSEQIEFLTPRQPSENERKGRSSGSLLWRITRGETNSDIPFVAFTWKPTQSEINKGEMRISYSASQNKYVRSVGHEEIKGWEAGVYEMKSVFRKEEEDWKMTYLARSEGCDVGKIKWKFDLMNTGTVIEKVNISCSVKLYETAEVSMLLTSRDSTPVEISLNEGNQMFETSEFQGKSNVELALELKGGTGDIAWQHAQLFRQEMNNVVDYPFEVTIKLKKML